ncbi:MAG: DUF4190 domain-containing protein [Actinomycetota bacterium]|nr:DUF4190 domain-containing protein [Actinomycetota bacterium]
MAEPTFINGAWWAYREDEVWLRWNPGANSWEEQPSGPQQQAAYQPYQQPSYVPQYGYGQPVYPQPAYPASPKTNGMAIASLILGILWVCWVGSILALVLGYVGKNQIDNSQGAETGRGLAIAGIALGWIGVAFLVWAIGADIADGGLGSS